jgi:hypothetical protein
MRISGRRKDGALYLSMGAGVAVILRGVRVSPPIDESAIDLMGPWAWSPDDNTDAKKLAVEKRLDHAHVTTDVIHLGLMSFEDGKKTDEPVSDIAESAQKTDEKAKGEEDIEVINLQPDAIAVAKTDEPPNPHFPAEERTKKRHALKDKIRGSVKSQKKVADVLEDEDITDDDLYAMAKSLGITDAEHPGAVRLVDNATRFRALLASTTLAKHLADKQEHPFTYCRDHIIPKMVEEGKGPDDPDAFCAWWKQENG